MKLLRIVMLTLTLYSATHAAQVKEIGEANVKPVPEIKKLFDALAGEWDTTEKRERTGFFPNGGARTGKVQTRLAAGGAMLVIEGHSDGSAGPLSYLIVVWWDRTASRYRYFICFKGEAGGCEVRGTAHWEGNNFVNDYEEIVDGKALKFRDTFRDISANSYNLIFAWIKDDGSAETVITTHAVRRRH